MSKDVGCVSGSSSNSTHGTLAGKAKWRLPTDEEALQIVKSGNFANDPASYVMWTSTKKGKKLALIVGITEGAVNPLPMQFDGHCRARCVLTLKKKKK